MIIPPNNSGQIKSQDIYNIVQILVNLWSAHMDPNVWEQPEKFQPERFLNDKGEVINRDRMIGFSLGMYPTDVQLNHV